MYFVTFRIFAVNVDAVSVPQFHASSHVALRLTQTIGFDFIFEVWFRTDNESGELLASQTPARHSLGFHVHASCSVLVPETGLLLFISQQDNPNGDYVSLTLDQGHLVFEFDLGSGPARIRYCYGES